jgi:hypothetical protein
MCETGRGLKSTTCGSSVQEGGQVQLDAGQGSWVARRGLEGA